MYIYIYIHIHVSDDIRFHWHITVLLPFAMNQGYVHGEQDLALARHGECLGGTLTSGATRGARDGVLLPSGNVKIAIEHGH